MVTWQGSVLTKQPSDNQSNIVYVGGGHLALLKTDTT